MRKFVVVLMVLTLPTPALAQRAARRDVITGTVLARATGAAVAGAIVKVEGTNLTATTSGTGRFTIENAPAGPVALTVEAAGLVRHRPAGGDVTARGRLRSTLSAHNLFNNEYYTEGDSELASPGAPRQVLFTTSVSFR